MTPDTPAAAWSGTYTNDPVEPQITFEDMVDIVQKMTKEPFLKEIRLHPSVHRRLTEFSGELASKSMASMPARSIYQYGGTPVFVDKKLKRGEWKAIDNRGNVMDQGNIFPPPHP